MPGVCLGDGQTEWMSSQCGCGDALLRCMPLTLDMTEISWTQTRLSWKPPWPPSIWPPPVSLRHWRAVWHLVISHWAKMQNTSVLTWIFQDLEFFIDCNQNNAYLRSLWDAVGRIINQFENQAFTVCPFFRRYLKEIPSKIRDKKVKFQFHRWWNSILWLKYSRAQNIWIPVNCTEIHFWWMRQITVMIHSRVLNRWIFPAASESHHEHTKLRERTDQSAAVLTAAYRSASHSCITHISPSISQSQNSQLVPVPLTEKSPLLYAHTLLYSLHCYTYPPLFNCNLHPNYCNAYPQSIF